MADNQFRKIRSHILRPTYMSLGLTSDMFRSPGGGAGTPVIDATLNGPGDILYVFKGSDYFAFDLRSRVIVRGPIPISNWASGTGGLPAQFASGIDAAAWGGEAFPTIYYFFKGDHFVRLDLPQVLVASAATLAAQGSFELQLQVTELDTIAGSWCCGEELCFIISSPSSVVHGVRESFGCLHFFAGINYLRHDLRTGLLSNSPDALISEQWQFPPFGGRIDAAFYGTGPEESILFLIDDVACARFDTRIGQITSIEPLEKTFPALAMLVARPQLFLVEDYSLEVHAGSLQRGEFARSLIVAPRTREETVIVTTVQIAAATALKQNMLQSEDRTTTNDYYTRLDDRQDESGQTDTYRYRMNAVFEGSAQAKGLWGGEVKANLGVQGGSDSQRDAFARSAMETVSSQVRDSTQKLSVTTLTTEQFASSTETFFSSQVRVVDNSASNVALEIQWFVLIEPLVSLLVLKGVRAAFTDGLSIPEAFSLTELPRRLPALLSDTAQGEIPQLLAYIAGELSRIVDVNGDVRSLLVEDPQGTFQLDRDVRSVYTVDMMTVPQIVDVRGILKAAQELLRATDELTSEENHRDV